MKYNYSKEKAKEVLKKYAEGGKVNAGTYRVGNPIKVGNMYEQKVAIISSNGDIRSNSEFGMTKTDFISMKYPKISEKKFYSLSNYAEGGSLGNHGLKHGDQIIKTMSGGVQKIKTKTGDIVYVNLANGYRGAEPPLPFATGGVTKNYVQRKELNTITIKKGDQKLTYKVSDVYNGAYKLEDGGNLQKTAFYVPKRNVVKVQLRDGKDVKVANGYWIKKGAKPIRASKFEDGGFMADVYSNGGVIGKEMTFYRHGEEEKGIIGEVNEDGSYNVSTKYSIILVEPQDVISIKDSTKKKGFFFDEGGSIERRYNTMSKEDKEELMREKIGVGRTPFSQYRKYNQLSNYHKNLVDKYFSGKLNYAGGGKTTFKQKATAIAKNFEGKKVEPKYQKEYGKTYDKAEAKEVGNKIAGSQKAKYDSKMSGGGTTKRGGSMQLAKQIRKEGESWGSAIKRANEQIRNK